MRTSKAKALSMAQMPCWPAEFLSVSWTHMVGSVVTRGYNLRQTCGFVVTSVTSKFDLKKMIKKT